MTVASDGDFVFDDETLRQLRNLAFVVQGIQRQVAPAMIELGRTATHIQAQVQSVVAAMAPTIQSYAALSRQVAEAFATIDTSGLQRLAAAMSAPEVASAFETQLSEFESRGIWEPIEAPAMIEAVHIEPDELLATEYQEQLLHTVVAAMPIDITPVDAVWILIALNFALYSGEWSSAVWFVIAIFASSGREKWKETTEPSDDATK